MRYFQILEYISISFSFFLISSFIQEKISSQMITYGGIMKNQTIYKIGNFYVT